MKQAVEFEDVDEVDDVPASPVLVVQRSNRYGSIPDLDDEELADPEELERQVMAEEWGPILRLPAAKRHTWIQPSIDESGGVDWGAFGTVDFDRNMPEFDKARYKAEKLTDQRKDILIMFSIVKERLANRATGKVLEYVRLGVIELDDIISEDMRALAKLDLRALRMQREIQELRERSRQRRQQRAEAWLRSL